MKIILWGKIFRQDFFMEEYKMDYSKFTKKSLEAIESSNNIARENKNTEICQEHLFYALLMQDDGISTEIIKGLNVNANELILDLKGKLVVDVTESVKVETNKDLEDTKEALKGLGFKVSDIDSVLKVVGQEKLTSQQYLKKALQLLRK